MYKILSKLLSKHNFSVPLALLLAILLSQTNIMNFFFNTVLGRTLLVLLIFYISYTNHILGVVTTLFVIMMFACCYNYAEGLDGIEPKKEEPEPTIVIEPTIVLDEEEPDPTSEETNKTLSTMESTLKDYMQEYMTDVPAPTTVPATTPVPVPVPVTTPVPVPTTVPVPTPVPVTTTESFTTYEQDNKYITTEGFDILGTERTLQRGKKSNTIMVNEDMRKSSHVVPFDGWTDPSCFTPIH